MTKLTPMYCWRLVGRASRSRPRATLASAIAGTPGGSTADANELVRDPAWSAAHGRDLLKGHWRQTASPAMNTAANPDARWLFPGERAGQPLTPGAFRYVFADLGIPTIRARTAAFRQLVLEAPPPVIAQALGYSAEHARLVAGLRRVGMPVAGIVALLGADRAAAHQLLDRHLRRLEDGLADARRAVAFVLIKSLRQRHREVPRNVATQTLSQVAS